MRGLPRLGGAPRGQGALGNSWFASHALLVSGMLFLELASVSTAGSCGARQARTRQTPLSPHFGSPHQSIRLPPVPHPRHSTKPKQHGMSGLLQPQPPPPSHLPGLGCPPRRPPVAKIRQLDLPNRPPAPLVQRGVSDHGFAGVLRAWNRVWWEGELVRREVLQMHGGTACETAISKSFTSGPAACRATPSSACRGLCLASSSLLSHSSSACCCRELPHHRSFGAL